MTRLLMGFGMLIALTGCAGVEHTRVTDDSKATGIRYYGTSYYLLVYATGTGSIQWEVMELPDQTKLMSARPYANLAQLDSDLEFVNGVLVQAESSADSTVVPRALMAAAGEFVAIAAEALAGAADANPLARPLPPPHLYKISPSGIGFEFVGGPAGKAISVTIPRTTS